MGPSKEEEDKYDPTKVIDMINKIRRDREAQLEGKIADKNIQVFNSMANQQGLKNLLFRIDEEEAKKMADMKVDKEKLETSQDHFAAMKFIAEKEKKNKFQNKRLQELERVMKQPCHTRTNIRVKFPDGYIIQGTFGAKETIGDVY
mmetsp:Transcript_3420/g.5793  ORF Transcript_3420/g.5793 Transcript_3420/m.5793 type:complete len:146 (-) Transcript_3420:251-688(-)